MSGGKWDNINDLAFCIGYCAAVTEIRYVDSDGRAKAMTVHQLAQLLDGYGVVSPVHSVEGDVVAERTTHGRTGA